MLAVDIDQRAIEVSTNPTCTQRLTPLLFVECHTERIVGPERKRVRIGDLRSGGGGYLTPHGEWRCKCRCSLARLGVLSCRNVRSGFARFFVACAKMIVCVVFRATCTSRWRFFGLHRSRKPWICFGTKGR